MTAGMPARGEGTVFGEIEYVELLSDTSDGACFNEGGRDHSLPAGDTKGGSTAGRGEGHLRCEDSLPGNEDIISCGDRRGWA